MFDGNFIRETDHRKFWEVEEPYGIQLGWADGQTSSPPELGNALEKRSLPVLNSGPGFVDWRPDLELRVNLCAGRPLIGGQNEVILKLHGLSTMQRFQITFRFREHMPHYVEDSSPKSIRFCTRLFEPLNMRSQAASQHDRFSTVLTVENFMLRGGAISPRCCVAAIMCDYHCILVVRV